VSAWHLIAFILGVSMRYPRLVNLGMSLCPQ
jgi:hypothetical protein